MKLLSIQTTVNGRLQNGYGTRLSLLIERLEEALFADANLPRRHRDRYVRAIHQICEFLDAEGAPANVVLELDELSLALHELNTGTVRPFLRTSVENRPSDPSDIWVCRAVIATALEFMTKDGTSKRDALTKLEKACGVLRPLLAPTAKTLSSAADSWLRLFRKGECKSPLGQKCFNELPQRLQTEGAASPSALAAELLGNVFSMALEIDSTNLAPDTLRRIRQEAKRRS